MPAGAIESGNTNFAFGLSLVPRDTAFGDGDNGLLKGCASPVEMAGGGWSPAGGVESVDASGLRGNEVWENGRD